MAKTETKKDVTQGDVGVHNALAETRCKRCEGGLGVSHLTTRVTNEPIHWTGYILSISDPRHQPQSITEEPDIVERIKTTYRVSILFPPKNRIYDNAGKIPV